MPTENEVKFLLQTNSEEKFKRRAVSIRPMRQGYLGFSKGMSLRIRETGSNPLKSAVRNDPRYELTFKQKVNNRVVEIEKRINLRDFEDLWSVSVNRLDKIRYDMDFMDHEGGTVYRWEVDAFKDHDYNTYIVIAEHEMPEGVITPAFIPPPIKESLI